MPTVVKTVQSYLDAPVGSPESQCRVKTRTLNVSGGPAGAGMTSETEKVGSIIVSRKYIVEYPDGYDEIQCLTAGAAWNDASNLVTKTRFWSDPVFKTRLKSVMHPDGTGIFYSYKADATTLDAAATLMTIITEGEPGVAGADTVGATDPAHPENGMQALNGTQAVRGTRTTSITHRLGGPVLASAAYPLHTKIEDIETGNSLDERLAAGVDGFGRLTEEHFLDGTVELTSYGCCGVESRTDRRGVVTNYADLTQSHTLTQSSQEIVWKTRTEGLDRYESRVATADNSEISLSHSQFNAAGQLIAETHSTGSSATYDLTVNAGGFTVDTTTYADGGTRIDTLHRDGTMKSVTGIAVAPVRYDYGVETDGTHWVKSIALDAQGDDMQEWVKTWQDLAGREFKVERSGGGAASSYFNSKGQLGKRVDADGVTTLFDYDTRGRLQRTVLDMNRNGSIEDNGTDRIARRDATITARADGRVVERTTQTVWTQDNDANITAALSTIDRAVDGLDSWITIGGIASQSHLAYAGNGAWTETTTNGDSSTLVRSYSGGRLAAEVRKDSSGVAISSATYAYDAHGRLWHITDGRGATTTYEYDGNDRLRTITGPAPGNGGAASLTTLDYDSMNRQQTVTDAANGTVTYTYWPTGAVHAIDGNRAYPISYTYTPQGRMETMTTATGVTTWAYDAVSGLLWKKRDATNKGPIFTYTTAGRLGTKTNARGSLATYAYNNAGENTSITYDDGITLATSYTFNRLGQLTLSDSGTVSETMELNPWGQLQTETFTGGPLGGLSVAHGYDALRRPAAVAAVLGSTTLTSQGYAYDDASRLKVVSSGSQTAVYDYDPAAGELISGVTLQQDGTTRMTRPRHYDPARRLEWVKALNAGGGEMFLASYDYNVLEQRTSVTREDGTKWGWGYNDRGEVTSGIKKFSDDTPHPVQQYSYEFDGIGNRTSSKKGGSDAAHTSTYTPNSLNQYTSRSMPPYLTLTGEAAANANVVVQGKSAARKGSAFWLEWNEDNSAGAVRKNVRVAAAKPGAGAGGTDLASLQTGRLYLPPTIESFTYDDDGNLTADARWTYTWDAENRLISAEEKLATLPAGWTRQCLEFTYDSGDRRTRKTVKEWQTNHWQTTGDLAFVYDGWNLIAEVDLLQGPGPTLRASYVWGLDMSGSSQGTGGVGGLLWAQTIAGGGARTHYAAYDGNGNIIGWVDASSGTPVLKLDYDPFGKVVMAASMGDATSSAVARTIPFRFSTKFTDRETGLNYYGYRYYSAELGRWISSDPMGEVGGVNLYGFLANAGQNATDALGLFESDGHYYAMFILLRFNGYSSRRAQKIAYYAQYPDQDNRYDAMHAGIRRGQSPFKPLPFDRAVQESLHQLNGLVATTQQCCLKNFLKTNWGLLSDWQRGVFLHALGDSFAHTSSNGTLYNGILGHSMDSIHGPDPDDPANFPERLRSYMAALNEVFGGAATSDQIDDLSSSLTTPVNVYLPKLAAASLDPTGISHSDSLAAYYHDRKAAKSNARILAQSFGLSNPFDPDDAENVFDPNHSRKKPEQIKQIMDTLTRICGNPHSSVRK